jgi:hypothetical protein
LLNTRQIRRSESQKFGEFLASTRIRQIRRRVAIAYNMYNIMILYIHLFLRSF